MNALVFFAAGIVILWIGYGLYGRAFARFLGVDPSRPTPAHTQYDGVDYVPARHRLVLFGHHFSSIAGAGPVIGPVIAVAFWGWGPAALFVLVGTICIGGVHDLGALVMSVRYRGHSIADISEEMVSRQARLVFSWFVLVALVVIVGVFIYFCAQTFIVQPQIVLPSLGLVPVAMLVGLMIYRFRTGLPVATVVGLGLLTALIVAGQALPVVLPAGYAAVIWTAALIVYCFCASIMPVNVLLQPRDYLSSYLLFFGIAAGFLGIITARPQLALPAFVSWQTSEGPLWPMLFVTVACGAISGFHSLVSAGTTSKQIDNERDARVIGYGGMVVEAVVALIAIVAVAGGFAAMGQCRAALDSGGPVHVFGQGFGHLTRYLFGDKGTLLALILLNSFILTTLDTSTRIARYILREMFSTLDRYLATALIVLGGGWLALSGKWKEIWPLFGAANQLIAALTLVVVSSWLLSHGKHTRFTLAPAVFMLVTAIGALGWQLGKSLAEGEWVLAVISVALVALATTMALEVFAWAVRAQKKKGNAKHV